MRTTGRIWNSCGQFEMESVKERDRIGQREKGESS